VPLKQDRIQDLSFFLRDAAEYLSYRSHLLLIQVEMRRLAPCAR
jgi:hypothetical protein